jgi:hypothetical protein
MSKKTYTIKVSTGRDNSSHKLPAAKTVKGSNTNLSHSLSGVSANQKAK